MTQQLDAAANKRLILVSAPAGFGKTTLLAEWLPENGRPWAWVSLDRTDSDLATFIAYFVAAVQTANPSACQGTHELLRAPQLPPLAQLATTLINDLAGLPSDALLVLDDYHVIRERAVHELLTALVYRLPRQLHLVIATRADPPLPIARWRATGYVAEIRAADLRFTTDEARAFLDLETGLVLPQPVFSRISESSEGWIASLKLVALSIRSRATHPEPAQVPDLAGIFEKEANRHVADFLMEDVLARQPKIVRDFLLRTAILDRFTAPLCDALGSDSTAPPSTAKAKDILKWIERANLFLVALDEQRRWYRYHHLFRSLLENQLRLACAEADIAQLHLRASAWFARQGLTEEAVQHALAAGDVDRAATLIEERKHDLLNHEDWHTIKRWLDWLPAELVERRPALLLARGRIMHFQGRYTQLQPLLGRVAVLLAGPAPDGAGMTPPQPLDSIQLDLEHRDLSALVALLVGDDPQAAHALLDGMWDRVSPSHEFLRGTLALTWAMASQFTGRFHEARQMLIAELSALDEHRGYVAGRLLLALSLIHIFEGQWDEGVRWAGRLLARARVSKSLLSLGWAHHCLGVCSYERNDLRAAAAHFQENAEHADSLNARCAHDSLVGLALTRRALGERAASDSAIEALESFDLHHAFPSFEAEAQSVRARLALLGGDMPAAQRWLGVTDVAQVMAGHLQQMMTFEIPQLTLMRVLIAGGRPADLQRAETELDRLLATARRLHAVRREIEILALQSLVQSTLGKSSLALDALALAQPRRFVRTFVDLGPELARLLGELVRRGRHSSYAGELLAAFDQPRPAPDSAPDAAPNPATQSPRPGGKLIEPLTNRETEILNLMAQHLTNDEIARALFISPLTVKSHTRNLFDKLGVKRRRFAIQRAQELGLLTTSPRPASVAT